MRPPREYSPKPQIQVMREADARRRTTELARLFICGLPVFRRGR